MRYFIDLTYTGTEYHGWQIQKNARSVQQILNESLGTILGENIETVGSGRTDTGVHARQQIAHFDIDKKLNPDTLVYKLNSFLPVDIAVNAIQPVKEGAHARFDALSRSYEYWINRKKDPFLINRAYYYRQNVDLKLMNQGSEILKNTENFQSFSKVKTEVNHFICHIREAEWKRNGDLLIYYITADRFLRGMVRAIVGTLISLGEQKITLEGFKEILKSKNRRNAGISVPAHGLYLTSVVYPETIYQN